MFNETPQEAVLDYNADTLVVLNESPAYYSSVKPFTMTAKEISNAVRRDKDNEARIAKFESRIYNVEEYLKENYEELDDHATEIAKLLGIDLTQKVEVTVDVTFTATLLLPMGTDISDVSTFDFEATLTSNSDFDIDDFDYDVNDVSEKY